MRHGVPLGISARVYLSQKNKRILFTTYQCILSQDMRDSPHPSVVVIPLKGVGSKGSTTYSWGYNAERLPLLCTRLALFSQWVHSQIYELSVYRSRPMGIPEQDPI